MAQAPRGTRRRRGAVGPLVAIAEAAQPRWWPALVADAIAAARYRGEPAVTAGGWAAVRQVLRLCWVTESFFALACYRLRVELRGRGVPVLPTVLHHLSVRWGQVAIGPYVVVEPGAYLPHGQVVIDGFTHVGAGVVLRPFVTLGLVDGNPIGPRIGAGTRIGTGAKVIGPIQVGANVQVGANAVVLRDVPDGATAVGVPARVR